MNKILISTRNLIKRKIFYIPAIIVILLGGGIFAGVKSNSPEYTFAKVTAADFIDEISVTGKVVPAQNVELAFESGGKVVSVNVTVGQQVLKGQSLASVNSGEAYASLLDAQARLSAEQARLQALLRGSRPEEIRIAETAVTNAKIDHQQTKRAIATAIVDAQITSDDVIKDKLNQFFYRNPGDNREDIISFQDFAKKRELDIQKQVIDNLVLEWGKSVSKLSISNDYTDADLQTAQKNLETMRSFLNEVAYAVSRFQPDASSLTQSTIDKYRSDVSIARGSINQAIGTLNSTQANLRTAESAIKTAEDNLSLKKAGSNPEDIATQRAIVRSAEANVLQASSVLGKASITAPFNGTVTKVDAKIGQISAPNTPVISLISASNFEVESNIPEADIAKVKIGNTGRLTLDAYGSATFFDVVITKMDPAETIVEGVATYKTTFQFTSPDERIKSGMSANIDIQNDKRSGVLMIPQSAIVSLDGKKKVLVIKDEEDTKGESRDIRTGSIDDEGNVEITNGLSEDEIVVTNPPKKI